LIARFAFVVSLLTFILERTFKVIITQGSREIMNPVLILWVISSAFAATYSDMNNLNKYLLSNYSRTLKPRINQDEQVFVNVDMILNSVIDFDVISGILSFVGLFSITWTDEQIGTTWNGSTTFQDINSTSFNVHDVWIPKFYIRNLADQSSIFQFNSQIDSETTFVAYTNNGTALIQVITVLQITCETDVTLFPFDTHSCSVVVLPQNQLNAITITTSMTSILSPFTFPNSEWSIASSVEHEVMANTIQYIIYIIKLSRKPRFLVVNLVLPSLFICAVNSLSFLIPIESGEKLSFGISLLLTFIVFLTTVLEKLPSSDAISIFNVCVFLQLSYSSLIVYGIIKTLQYYHYKGKNGVPEWLSKVVQFILRPRCNVKTTPEETRKEKSNFVTSYLNDNKDIAMIPDNRNNDSCQVEDPVEDNMTHSSAPDVITWQDVGLALDKILKIVSYCVIFFIIVQVIIITIALNI